MENSLRIKICGITQKKDAQLAVQLGAFALGFIFYEKSPRFVRPEEVRVIIDSLPKNHGVKLVGVFVNADRETIESFIKISGINTVQLHGDEALELAESLRDVRVWKAFRLKEKSQFASIEPFAKSPKIDALLFDAAVAGQFGGTGHTVDWELVEKASHNEKTIVAGGLHAGNIREAHRKLRPYALDLSSGVESSPGIKDHEKLKLLFAEKG